MRSADLASLVGKRARFGNLVVLQAVVVGRSRSAADAHVMHLIKIELATIKSDS